MADPTPHPPGGEERPGAFEEMPVEQRHASLVLRKDDLRESRAASMEAANKSLADALRITYRLLQGVMVALVLLFLFSGVSQVAENERGLQVTFGAISNPDLEPGPHFSLPYPMGDIVKVSTVNQTVDTVRSFVPRGFQTSEPLNEQGMGTVSLNPKTDGSLITADVSLAHAQVTASYRRSDPVTYLRSIDPETEIDIVRAALERATVHAVANATIDDLLGPGPGASADDGEESEADVAFVGSSSIGRRIRILAQESLDAIDAGIDVERVDVTRIFPPLRVLSAFNRVNEVDIQASGAREAAEEEASRTMNQAAGAAHPILADLIDEYGRRLDLGDRDGAEATLEVIRGVLDGELAGDVEALGRTYPAVVLSGAAAKVMSDARLARQTIVTRARERSDVFLAKLEQYRANPDLFLVREWTDALREFLAHEQVQSFVRTPDGEFQLQLNNDPDIVRQQQLSIQELLTLQNARRQSEAGRGL